MLPAGQFTVSWKALVAGFGLVTGTLAMAKTAVVVSEMPERFAAHDNAMRAVHAAIVAHDDSVLAVLKEVRDVENKLLCVKVAELRHVEWARCLLSSHTPE